MLVKKIMNVNVPISKVAFLIEDCQFQLECNSRIKIHEVVEEVCKNVQIVYQKTYSNFFVSSRDFLVCAVKFDLKNKMIALTNHSVEYPEIDPKESVRGSVNSLYILEAISKKTTKIISVLRVNLKGSVGRFITGKMADTQHDSFSILKNKLEQYHMSV